MRGAEGGCGSFRRCCFPEKARYRTDWKIGPEKTRFLRSFALCFPLRLFPISVYFPCYSSARRSGRVRSLCLRAKFSRICLAFCLSLPNYELTPISESMCESPFRCRCAVAEDAGFARKRGDYMYKENPFDSEPEPKGYKVVGEVFIPLICGSRVRVIWAFSYCLRRRPSSSCACLRTASSVCSPRPSSYRCLWRAFRGAWRR